jgi:hypothetical protein
MKNRKSKCLNHLTELTILNLKCHIIYFSRGFYNNQENQSVQWRECFKILPQFMILSLYFYVMVWGFSYLRIFKKMHSIIRRSLTVAYGPISR